MRTQTSKKTASPNKDLSAESHLDNEEYGSMTSILGKRNSNENSVEQLRGETEESRDESDSGLDSQDKRERR